MKRETILAQYRAWLTHREYSPATIQKYRSEEHTSELQSR